MMSSKTFTVSLIIIGIIINCIGFIAHGEENLINVENSFLIETKEDWIKAGFKNDELPVYKQESLINFYMPIAFKKTDITSLKANDINYRYENIKGDFETRDKHIEHKIMESSTHYVILYNMTIKASTNKFSIDFIPEVKGQELKKYAWWNSNWNYYTPIHIDGSQVAGSLTNFPVLINCTDTTIISECDNGDSIRFVNDANDTEYYYEIDEFTSNGFDIWVNLTSLTSSGLDLNMYYGNVGASDSQSSDTWNSDYIGIFHMNTSTTTTKGCYDSSTYGYHATYEGSLPTTGVGHIGKGQYFDGSGDKVTLDSNCYDTQTLTVEMFTDFYATNANYVLYWSEKDGNNKIYFNARGDVNRLDTDARYEGTTTLTVDQGTTFSTDYRCFQFALQTDDLVSINNGAIIGTDTSGATTLFTPIKVHFGSYGTGAYFKGTIDEVKISGVRRSNAWLYTSYNTVNNRTTFAVFGTTETLPISNNLPQTSNFNIGNNTENIGICENLSFYLSDLNDDSITYNIEGDNNICSKSGTINQNGTIWLNCTNCKYLGHNYTIWVNLTDDNITYSSFYYEFRTEECCESNNNGSDEMEITIGVGLLGILLTLVIFYLGFKVDEEEKKNIWKPILFFLDVPIALATGIHYLGNTMFEIQWWLGIIMFCFAIILSMAGLYYGLNFGRR